MIAIFNKGLILFFLSVLFIHGPARADKSHVRVDLLSEVMSIQPSHSFSVAIRMKMDPGWHTYWKNPGDSGLATQVKWTLPKGFKAGPLEWPNPEKISTPPLVSYGYSREVFFLVRITPPSVIRHPEDNRLSADVSWLECKEECAPGQASLQLHLPIGIENPAPNPDMLKIFSQARFEMPLQQSDWSLRSEQNRDQILITLEPPAQGRHRIHRLTFFPDLPGVIDNASPQTLYQRGTDIQLVVMKSKTSTTTVDNLSGVLVTHSGWRGPGSERGLVIHTPLPFLSDTDGPARPAVFRLTIGTALFFAFLGGMLLNLMPCVLPVLSIKIMGFINQRDISVKERAQHSIFYSVGVILSFLSLAGLLLLLRAGGESLGWGFQLQSPGFVLFLIILLYCLAISYFGVYEIGTGLLGLGGTRVDKSTVIGSVLSGVLATVVATPCTAPFMGSALGYALTVPAHQSLLIFASLGVGMALPYLVLTIHPVFLKKLPRPGPWMQIVKGVMGLLMLMTVFWLSWVLIRQTTLLAVPWLVAGLGVISFALWIYRQWRWNTHESTHRWKYIFLTGILFLGGVVIAGQSIGVKSMGGAGLPRQTTAWKTYSDDRLNELLKQGRPVFIDFTASWCLTCQVNERVVLSHPDVQKDFQSKNVALLKADWTSRDEFITRALERYGRSGVPTYVLMGGGDGSSIQILPEVLTKSIVVKALNKI